MVQVSLPRSRSVVTAVVALALASALVALAGPAEAGRRPPPRALRATADQTSLTVQWHWVRKAPGYRVRWSVNRSMAGSHRIATTRHRVRIGGLAPDTRYFVQVAVAARHGHGRRLGPWSRVLARRTPPPPCPTMGNLGDPTPAPATGVATDLRVATFNIRTMNFDSATAPTQMWANRADRVASLLLGADTASNEPSQPPDVIALQEANQSYAKFAARCTNQMIDLRNRLDAGSGRHFEATSLDPASSIGTRILFDTTRLRLERAGSVLLAPASIDHPHLAWAIFQVRNGGQEFFFGSVHLAPGEGPEANAVRNSEWDLLVSTLTSGLTEGHSVVLAGDFNSPRSGGGGANTAALNHIPQMAGIGVEDALLGNPKDPADKTLTIDQSRPAVDTPGYLPVNAHCASFNGFQTAQRCEDDHTLIGQQIDYVFASNNLPVKSWEMVLDVDPFDNWIGTIPSDHNLVRATVTLPGT
jgi:endonuclease/exonuclease/phosphatase family metal-dependent hydrolase